MQAVDTVIAALTICERGHNLIPRVPAALLADIARALIGDRSISQKLIGLRPGEKFHELLVSDEEADRCIERVDYFVVRSQLPEIVSADKHVAALTGELNSDQFVMTYEQTKELLVASYLFVSSGKNSDEPLR